AEPRAILFPAAVGLFPCDDCGGQFSSQTFLSAHCKSVHAKVEPPEVGLLHRPSRPYATRSEYDTPNHERPFVAQKRTLSEHLKTHSGVRPYGCGICGDRFVQKSALHSHKRKHMGKSLYVCEECGQGFCRLTDLFMHEETHAGDCPYVC
ncbi:unnamed protein product, partial [Ixodes persulcatus]